MNSKISICIPVWECNGYGCQYLNDLMNTIHKQTVKPHQIVISDHSKHEDISEYILGVMYYYGLNITYVKYREKYGNGVANLNNALRHANGEIIKIMFQDDLMFSEKCLESIENVFLNDDVKWVVSGCNHTRDGVNFQREMIPAWNDKLLDGINTISSPSVLAFRNQDIEYFDDNLVMLMDVEYYYRMGQKYGLPTIIKDCLVSNRIHANQISSRYDKDINEEIKYVKFKYKNKLIGKVL